MIDLAMSIKGAGVQVGILSNMPPEHCRYYRKQHSWIGGLDYVFFSSEISLAKPDRAIYHHVMNTIKVEAGGILFIDDKDENLEVARAVGILVYHYGAGAQSFGGLHRRLVDASIIK